MSIVERALQKLQASRNGRGHEPAVPSTVVQPGGPVSREEPRPPTATVIEQVRPRRRVVHSDAEAVHIDMERLMADGLLPPQSEQRQMADQYRAIKRPLIQQAFHSDDALEGAAAAGSRAIMVASALPGEGKTFTSLNLALSLALEKDHTVLLVDGDVAKPHLSEVMGLGEASGLLDVLGDPSRDIETVIRPTDLPRLSVLPVGKRSETATELLASSRMKAIISQLEALDSAGIVVVDSPPILLTSEAQVLASLFGQVVIVVKASGTPQQAVLEAVRIVGERPHVSLVLNQASGMSPTGYYGSGYGYGYGYGSDFEQGAGRTPRSGENRSVAATHER